MVMVASGMGDGDGEGGGGGGEDCLLMKYSLGDDTFYAWLIFEGEHLRMI